MIINPAIRLSMTILLSNMHSGIVYKMFAPKFQSSQRVQRALYWGPLWLPAGNCRNTPHPPPCRALGRRHCYRASLPQAAKMLCGQQWIALMYPQISFEYPPNPALWHGFTSFSPLKMAVNLQVNHGKWTSLDQTLGGTTFQCWAGNPLQPSRAAVARSWVLCKWDCTSVRAKRWRFTQIHGHV